MKRAVIAAALALVACDAEVVLPPPTPVAIRPPSDLPAFFDCLRERGVTAVSAHRGGPARGFAENAIPTFENTLHAAPMSLLEVDVAQTADDVLVLMHDDRIERTTTGAGAVRDLDMAQLLAFSLEDDRGRAVDARVPTLREALEWAEGRAVFELDIKRGVAYEDVIAEVEAAGAMNRVVFITYSVEGAARLARLAPQGMIYTTITSARELDVLERRGVDLTRIVAWTGASAPGTSLVRALTERGVEARFGMFGNNRNYADAIRAGAQIVAVDDAGGAYRDIDAADGVDGYAAAQCVNR
jgi:glycerophosphoryl diester phosphodiesterase